MRPWILQTFKESATLGGNDSAS